LPPGSQRYCDNQRTGGTGGEQVSERTYLSAKQISCHRRQYHYELGSQQAAKQIEQQEIPH
jgi:hypothetical protein